MRREDGAEGPRQRQSPPLAPDGENPAGHGDKADHRAHETEDVRARKAPDAGARRMNSPERYQTMNAPLTMLNTPAAVGFHVLISPRSRRAIEGSTRTTVGIR